MSLSITPQAPALAIFKARIGLAASWITKAPPKQFVRAFKKSETLQFKTLAKANKKQLPPLNAIATLAIQNINIVATKNNIVVPTITRYNIIIILLLQFHK